jgi:hypothetical protein
MVWRALIHKQNPITFLATGRLGAVFKTSRLLTTDCCCHNATVFPGSALVRCTPSPLQSDMPLEVSGLFTPIACGHGAVALSDNRKLLSSTIYGIPYLEGKIKPASAGQRNYEFLYS